MTHFGVLCPEVPGHLNPMTALCRELVRRGHRVTLYQRPMSADRVAAAGLDCRVYAAAEFPADEHRASVRRLGGLTGLAALRYTVELFRATIDAAFRHLPGMLRADGVDVLLTDQTCGEGPTLAASLGLPFVTVCNALILSREPAVPPFCFPWRYRDDALGRARNRLAYAVLDRLARPIVALLNEHRARLRLPPMADVTGQASPFAHVSQQPAAFDFPRKRPPINLHYTSPWTDAATRPLADFPFERLDPGRPLVYASMGTVQNGQARLFAAIAAACAGSGAQLVLSLGGGGPPADLPPLPGDPVVVPFAPQLELLRRATLCVTHAGMNTALECLNEGVPMVAIPVTNDQPGVAARIAWTGAGEFITPRRLTGDRLRALIERVTRDETYRANARRLQQACREGGGVAKAADVIEGVAASRAVVPEPTAAAVDLV